MDAGPRRRRAQAVDMFNIVVAELIFAGVFAKTLFLAFDLIFRPVGHETAGGSR